MKSEQEGNWVLDTGPLVEILRGSPLGNLLKNRLESGAVTAVTGEMNICELRYLACRESDWKKSSSIINKLLGSGYFGVLPASGFVERAAQLKCFRSLSLVDCLTISMGDVLKAPVLFATHEDELEREIGRENFKSPEILFLEDLLAAQGARKMIGP